MSEHLSSKLVIILCLITASLMAVFAGIRFYHNSEQFEMAIASEAQIISDRVASQVMPSIWDIYLSAEHRSFSEEVASAVLDSEMQLPDVDAVVVYGRFGHVYMGRVKDDSQEVINYTADQHSTYLMNHPRQVSQSIRNGVMTIGKVTVYFNDQPLRIEQSEILVIDLIQTALFSVFIVLVLFFTIKKVLIKPMASLEIAKDTFNSLGEGLLHLDNDNRVFNVNPAFTAMTGFKPSDILDRECTIFQFDEADGQPLLAFKNPDKIAKGWSGEAMCTRKNGDSFPVLISLSQVFDQFQEKMCRVVVFQDISRQKEDERKLKDLAFYDSLTGLTNRRRFEDLIAVEIENSRQTSTPFGLLFIDIDDFKFINDTLGHSQGDELLRIMSNRFRQLVPNNDNIARLGGDEFTVIAPSLSSKHDLTKLAENLIHAANQPLTLQGEEYRISVTIGISQYPKDGQNLSELMKHADGAMYQAKSTGKGHFTFYSSELDQKIQRRQQLKALLRNCIERDELYLLYQPKVSLSSGKQAIGAEALLRWDTPEFGLVSPDEFIPIAEESHSIITIGEWVIKQVLRQVATWNHNHSFASMRVSINLSSHQLHDRNLLPLIEQTMEKTKVSPAWVEFEVTESSVIENFERSVVALEQLKERGFTIALDDFGTGYSSLNYLTKLPVDVLKIDKSFVFEVGKDSNAESVIEAVVTLSKSLDLVTVAEGIETKEHLEFLLKLGCEYGQGYYFSRPLPMVECERYLAKEGSLSTVITSQNSSKTLQ